MKNILTEKEAVKILKRIEKGAKPSKALVEFVHEQMMYDHHYMFQYKENKIRMGHCTHCNKDYPIEISQMRTYSYLEEDALYAHHNEVITCPKCGHKVTKRYAGYSRHPMYSNVAEFKRDTNGALIVYVYEFYYNFSEDIHNQAPEWRCYQIGYFDIHKYFNTFYSSFQGHNVPNLSDKWTTQLWFCLTKKRTYYPFCYHQENFEGIACFNAQEVIPTTNLKYCCLEQYMGTDNIDMFKYLKFYCAYPEITERLIKQGFKNTLRQYFYGGMSGVFNFNAKTVPKFLKLTKQNLKAYKSFVYESREGLLALQMAQRYHIKLSSDNLRFLEYHSKNYQRIKLMLNFVGFQKMRTYISRQSENYANDEQQWKVENGTRFFEEYNDYLEQCKTLGYDLNDKKIVFPINLRQSHQQLTELTLEQKAKKVAELHEKENKKFQKRLKQLQKKYCFEDDMYLIRPAESYEDLLKEATALHHCVYTNYSNPYIVQGSTNILLIRKKSEPNIPFYTMEYKCGEVIQCRTKYNHSQTPEVAAFINKWLETVNNKKLRKVS